MRKMSGAYNILVISDLHLGEDLNPSASVESARDLALAERHLVAFLAYYTRRRVDGLPWRLVINGDMLDLLTICLFPHDNPQVAWTVLDQDERRHGLGRRVDASCAKIDAVIDRHGEFVRASARFLAAGNRIDIVCGNHDAELHWEDVQKRFRQGVTRVWRGMPEAGRPNAPSGADIEARIDFHSWFFYEPGVAWIEHGHQYDECCCFEYNLNPVDADGRFLVTNVDTAGMRYLTNMVPEVAPHGSEEWSMAGYLRLVFDSGMRSGWQMGRGYAAATYKLLREWRASRSVRDGRKRRERHIERLRALSETTPLTEAKLRALSGLQRRPVITSLRRLLQVLMLDKLVLWIVVGLMLTGAYLLLPLGLALIVATCMVVAALGIGEWLGRGRQVDPELPLDLVPERILDLVDARFVIFGHTHNPVARPLSRGRWYFNTGTWMPSGKPGLLRSFTHVIVQHQPTGAVASLCQWRDGASRAFTPDGSLTLAPSPTIDDPDVASGTLGVSRDSLSPPDKVAAPAA